MIIEKSRRWPVPMYRFYGVKHLRKNYKSPAVGMDYGHFVRTHGWTSPIFHPRVIDRGYHVYIRRDAPLTSDPEDGDRFCLAECVVPITSVDSMIRFELTVACTSIRLLKYFEVGDNLILGYDGEDVLGVVHEDRKLLDTLSKEANQ